MSALRFPHARTRVGAVVLAAVTLVGGSACSGASSTAPATTAAASPSTDAAVASPAPSTTPANLGQVVAITVAGGKVTGPKGRVKIKQGSVVTLRVISDVADEVHLHGYDKHVDVEKGGTADLTFTATLTGVFEAELETRALRLTELQVQ